jgi:DNA-directed RNA polymerase specialized sigma24 family protein
VGGDDESPQSEVAEMAIVSGGQRAKTIQVPGKPLKKAPDKLPWPRLAEDDGKTHLGVDVIAKEKDIIRLVHKFFKVEDVPMEELIQEVYVAIIHKNYTRSAHDPRKSSFGHYVYMVANNVCINLVHRKKRYDKERDSIDAPHNSDDNRTMLDTVDVAAPDPQATDALTEHMEEVEATMRKKGMWDVARYLRAARSGANPDVIREALSWGNHKVSSKTIRDIRAQVQDLLRGAPIT